MSDASDKSQKIDLCISLLTFNKKNEYMHSVSIQIIEPIFFTFGGIISETTTNSRYTPVGNEYRKWKTGNWYPRYSCKITLH